MYVCMYVCTYVRTYICMYICMYVKAIIILPLTMDYFSFQYFSHNSLSNSIKKKQKADINDILGTSRRPKLEDRRNFKI
jgi:hypothetical protein